MNSWLRARCGVDRVVALGLVAVLAPIAFIVAAVIRVRDGLPVVIRLPRMGQGLRVFQMHKFRTMIPGAANGLAVGERLTLATDDRITRTGQWLRHSRLDELPQLLDVVLGRMVLIGPRPEAPEFIDRANPGWHHILTMPPGIAGLTQLVLADLESKVLVGAQAVERYRDALVPLKLDVDLFYINHAGPKLDLLIVIAVLSRLRGGESDRLFRYLNRHSPSLADRISLLSPN